MEFEDQLLALEQRVLQEAAGDFLIAVADLRRMLLLGLPGVAGKLVSLALPDLEARARTGVADAYRLGGDYNFQAATIAPTIGDNEVSDARIRLDQGAPAALVDPIVGLDALVVEAKGRAVALLNAGGPVEEAAGPIFNAATTVKARIETQVNAASNQAAETVGEAVRSPMVWEAERDACVYCLALAGMVVERAGDEFPKADLYAEVPASQPIVSRPPLHPHCRCRLSILVDQSFADALQREAQRSILRGFSLKSESEAVRVRAAERLLARDPVAPKSVKAYAEKAVREGKFPRGRDVPDGDPRLVIN